GAGSARRGGPGAAPRWAAVVRPQLPPALPRRDRDPHRTRPPAGARPSLHRAQRSPRLSTLRDRPRWATGQEAGPATLRDPTGGGTGRGAGSSGQLTMLRSTEVNMPRPSIPV